jgi:hypothetical protein
MSAPEYDGRAKPQRNAKGAYLCATRCAKRPSFAGGDDIAFYVVAALGKAALAANT